MTEKQPLASKNTIDNLITNSSMVIDELYKSLKGELVVRSLMDNSTPSLYILTQDLQNGIKFMLMDIGVACKAELSVENVYEKRFHIKNIYASISEGYKLLFNFGKSRKESLWKKLMEKLQENSNPDLIAEGLEIENRLVIFETNIDKELRDFTYHYDKQMFEVYQKTVEIDSEEKVMQVVCIFFEILQDIILFTEKIDAYCFALTNIEKASPTDPIKLNINTQHKNVNNLIDSYGQLKDFFDKFFPESIRSIDLSAKYINSSKHIEEYILTKTPIIGEIKEIGHLQTLFNLQMLLKFMILDIASVLQAYIKSSSDIESALNLRRVCIIKVSTMVHLYGYNENENRQAIWEKIKDLIPSNYSLLQKESDSITELLRKIVSNSNDKDLRTYFVHLYDNSNKRTNVANVIQKIEEINPIIQVVEIMMLIEVYKQLINFTTKLMDTIYSITHDRAIKSNKEMNDKIDQFIKTIINAPLSDEYKRQICDNLNNLKIIINTSLYT